MDFRNRNNQPAQQVHSAPAANGSVTQQTSPKRDQHWSNIPNWLRIANVIMLFSITIVAISVVILMRNNNPNESKFVAEDKYQAVFLNNGQVYFGKISALNGSYVNLQNVFYLNSQSKDAQSTENKENSDQFTLVKLGCELHGPYDQMIINRDQVTFWENLKSDGQVVKTIDKWIEQNPNGQKCTVNTDSTEQSNGNSQNATSEGTQNPPASNKP